MQGPFQSIGQTRLPRFALLVDLSSPGLAAAGLSGREGTLSLGASATDGQLFLSLGGMQFVAPASTLRALERGYAQGARSRSSGGTSPTFAALGIDPGRWLTHPMLAGSATIAGERTTHIVTGLDVRRFLADALTLSSDGGTLGLGAAGSSGLISAAQISALSHSVRSARVDVYTGAGDHQLRRLSVSASVVARGRARSALGGLPAARLTLVLEFSDLNQPQRITAPSNPLPLAELGSASAHSGPSSRSTPSSSSSSSSSLSSSRSSSGSGSAPAPWES